MTDRTKKELEIGFLPEHFRFHDCLTGRERLRFHGRLYGLRGAALERRIDSLLRRVDLLDAADRSLRDYSKGMTQRAGLAQALLYEPDLVFLDEPTSGLDPLGRLLVRDQTPASKPIRRAEIVLGKWLAYWALIAAYVGLTAGGVLVVENQAGREVIRKHRHRGQPAHSGGRAVAAGRLSHAAVVRARPRADALHRDVSPQWRDGDLGGRLHDRDASRRVRQFERRAL